MAKRTRKSEKLLNEPHKFGLPTLTAAGWVKIRAPWIAKMGLAPESTAPFDYYESISWNYIVERFELPEFLKLIPAAELLAWSENHSLNS